MAHYITRQLLLLLTCQAAAEMGVKMCACEREGGGDWWTENDGGCGDDTIPVLCACVGPVRQATGPVISVVLNHWLWRANVANERAPGGATHTCTSHLLFPLPADPTSPTAKLWNWFTASRGQSVARQTVNFHLWWCFFLFVFLDFYESPCKNALTSKKRESKKPLM